MTTIDERLVLAKSFGPFSAGTRLNPTEITNVYAIQFTDVTKSNDPYAPRSYSKEIAYVELEIPKDCVEVLRSRTDVVPAIPRSQRPDRLAKRTLYNMMHKGESS